MSSACRGVQRGCGRPRRLLRVMEESAATRRSWSWYETPRWGISLHPRALRRGRPPSAVELLGELLQGAVEEDAHGTLRSVEHLADLPGAQSIGEAQQHDLPPVVRERDHCGADSTCFLRPQRETGRVRVRGGR